MELIDFSCKHNVLIKDDDGTLRPMDEPYFNSEKIASGIWMNYSDGDYFYLVEGEEEALTIDSGYGCGNVRDYLQTLTTKPVKNIANTHDHFDHTANNCYFDCAYMSEETKELATIPFPSFDGIIFPRDYNIEIIDEGYIFRLGDRDIETFKIPDHAIGSLAFLDKKEGILFSGDEIGMPMGKTLNGSVEKFAGLMMKLYKRRTEFSKIATGIGVFDAIIIDQYLKNAMYILEGNEGEIYTKNDFPTADESTNNVIYNRRAPRPCDLPKNGMNHDIGFKRIMSYGGCNIIYDIRKIYE